MTRVADIMKEYFQSETAVSKRRAPEEHLFRPGLLTETRLPVEVESVEWSIKKEPERFERKFTFDDRKRLTDFVSEILALEDEMGHHSQMTIDHKSVLLIVNTKNVEKITELDIEFTQEADKIFKDVLDYNYKEKTYEL